MEDEVLRQLLANYALDEFGKEGEKGDRTIIVQILGTEARLLQQGSDIGELHLIWKDTRGERQVHYGSDSNSKLVNESLEKRTRGGIRWAGFNKGHNFSDRHTLKRGKRWSVDGHISSRTKTPCSIEVGPDVVDLQTKMVIELVKK
jgi:hypothetical protein